MKGHNDFRRLQLQLQKITTQLPVLHTTVTYDNQKSEVKGLFVDVASYMKLVTNMRNSC